MAATILKVLPHNGRQLAIFEIGADQGTFSVDLNADLSARMAAVEQTWVDSAVANPEIPPDDRFRQVLRETPSDVVKRVLSIDDAKLDAALSGGN